MAENKEKMTAAEAFGAFAKKFIRSTQAKDTSKPNIVYDNDILQKKINIREQEYSSEIITSYAKYLNPFRTFGKQSKQAEAISSDEKNLVKAYNIFKAVREANMSIGDAETFCPLTRIESPLTRMAAYTEGGEFIYLQCWLLYAQGISDFVPELKAVEEKMQTHYELHFSPLKTFSWSYQEKEVIAAIEAAYKN